MPGSGGYNPNAGGPKLTPTKTFSIRLDPGEIAGCIDVCEVTKSRVDDMSLSMAIRAAVTILIYNARKAGAIPEYDPYNYSSKIARYRDSSVHRRILAGKDLTALNRSRAGLDKPPMFERELPGLTGETEEEEHVRVRANAERLLAEHAREQKTARPDPRLHRLKELQFRAEQDPANVSKAEFRELKKLQQALGATT